VENVPARHDRASGIVYEPGYDESESGSCLDGGNYSTVGNVTDTTGVRNFMPTFFTNGCALFENRVHPLRNTVLTPVVIFHIDLSIENVRPSLEMAC
jgi:hypothetical protein